jgi:hypothetical protein
VTAIDSKLHHAGMGHRIAIALTSLALFSSLNSPAQSQVETPERSGASESSANAAVEQLPGSTATTEVKPSFVLPDVVVEGEDMSRLAGGIRLLETDAPTVDPGQQPLVVNPSASRYLPRIQMPFDYTTPPPRVGKQTRGWLRLRGEQDLGLAVAAVWTPDETGRTLLWIDGERHEQRLPGYELTDGVVGFLHIDRPESPHRKMGGMVKLIDGSNDGEFDPSQSFLSANLFIEGLSTIGGWPGIMGFDLSAARTTSDFTGVSGKQKSEWIGAMASISSQHCRENLYDPETARTEVDVTAGLLSSDASDLDTEIDIRVNGHMGRSFFRNDSRYAIGVAAVGDSKENQLGPWCYWRWTPREKSWLLYAEIAPAVLFADDLLMGRSFFPGYSDHRGSSHPAYAPQVPSGRATYPFSAKFNPQLPPQRAWPRLLCRFRSDHNKNWFQLSGELAELTDPVSWRALGTDEVLTTHNTYFESVSAARRLAGYLQAELSRIIAGDLSLYVSYVWSYDEESDSAEALTFQATHQASVYLTGQRGQWLWGGGMAYRGESRSAAISGEIPGTIDSWVSLGAYLGWSLRAGRLIVHGENLLGDEAVIQPGIGYDEPRLKIGWEQTF